MVQASLSNRCAAFFTAGLRWSVHSPKIRINVAAVDVIISAYPIVRNLAAGGGPNS
jgi:hypothetical protein